ncbi:MAG: Holliday junction branch migration protein RuvA [Patescibacteria group bacterium]
MISYINGTVRAVIGKTVTVEVRGIGYRVTIPEKNLKSIAKIGAAVKLYTHYSINPRDGTVGLYGFATPEELNFFELLTTISGIGPKSAQAILSAADLQQLQLGIFRGDDGYLTKVAGIGPKTAARLVLELKNKIMAVAVDAKTGGEMGAEEEAIEALTTLGYSQYQARDAIKAVNTKAASTEEKIKEALRFLGGKK